MHDGEDKVRGMTHPFARGKYATARMQYVTFRVAPTTQYKDGVLEQHKPMTPPTNMSATVHSINLNGYISSFRAKLDCTDVLKHTH